MNRQTWLAAANLTPAQIAVLTEIANGRDRIAAAARLHYSQSTVASYLADVRRRLGARSTAHAVAIAVAAGVVRVGGPPECAGGARAGESMTCGRARPCPDHDRGDG